MEFNMEDEEEMLSYQGEEDIVQAKIRFKGKKNPNNPRELLNKSSKVFISKKANYVNCATCYCCIGENIYKIYKYKGKNEQEILEEDAMIKPFTHNLWQKNVQISPTQMEGGEKEKQGAKKRTTKSQIAPGGANLSTNRAGPSNYNSNLEQVPALSDPRLPSEVLDLNENQAFQPPPLAFDETSSPAVLKKMQQNPYQEQRQVPFRIQEFPMPVQSQKGSKGKRIMKIDEDSILCPMVFCPAQCRPHSSYAVSSNGIFELARFIKDYRCTFMGCNRPELLVYRTEFLNTHDNSHSLETLIGKVVNPLCCGSMEAMIFETVGGELQRRYLVNGDWCQVSSCCPSWLCCQKVRFFINDIRFQDHQNPNAVQRVQESQVQKQGKIEKIYSKFIKEFFSHGAHYKITFPENSSVDQKILILAAFQMLDMGYFDKKGCIPGICCC